MSTSSSSFGDEFHVDPGGDKSSSMSRKVASGADQMFFCAHGAAPIARAAVVEIKISCKKNMKAILQELLNAPLKQTIH